MISQTVMRCLVLVALLIAAARPVRAGVQAPRDIGFVLDVSGSWVLSGEVEAPVVLGGKLPEGGVLEARSTASASANGANVAVVLWDGTLRTTTCANGTGCHLVLPRIERPSLEERIVRAVHERFKREPDRYVNVISRQGEVRGGAPHDAVVALTRDGLDVAPVLRGLGKSTLLIELRPLGSERDIPARAYEWDPSHPTPLAEESVAPGLMAVLLREPSQFDGSEIVAEAWVLAAPRRKLRSLRRSFERLAEPAKDWSDDRSARIFRHACLELALDER